MSNRVKQIVAVQLRAAELQAACKWMPAENFFANMIGHMGLVYGPELAADVVSIFEKTRQDQEEMLDDMCRDPKQAVAAFQEGVANWAQKRGAP